MSDISQLFDHVLQHCYSNGSVMNMQKCMWRHGLSWCKYNRIIHITSLAVNHDLSIAGVLLNHFETVTKLVKKHLAQCEMESIEWASLLISNVFLGQIIGSWDQCKFVKIFFRGGGGGGGCMLGAHGRTRRQKTLSLSNVSVCLYNV